MVNPLRWSKGAIQCYNIGCRCSICNIVPLWFKDKCRMKESVIELVKKFGKPINEEEEDIE